MKPTSKTETQSSTAGSDGPNHAGNDRFGLDRLIFFSDAVFAIAITLLALDINLPQADENISSAELWTMLASLRHDYSAYVTSFVVIGIFWLGHHAKFRSIARYDRTMIWLNLLLLMTVAFLPFPTRVMSDYFNSAATIFYAVTVSFAGILTVLINFYAVHNNRLVDSDTPLHKHMQRPWRLFIVPLIFLLSIPIAIYEPMLARYFWLLLIPLEMLKANDV